MQKVDGVQNVRVSLNDGLTILDLKPGNAVTLMRLRQIIKNNGFVSKEATVVARGTVVAGQRFFTVGGTNEQLMVTSPPQRNGDDWRLVVPASPKR
jgi:hypothetical protein